ncbi:MAG: glycosyltransferase family 39 protein [Bacteroidetes bacterium]|nr:glycosyltransferase family 39 protein [Bacteroidota bacterium]
MPASNMKDNNKQLYFILLLVALAVNFAGINLKFFTDDPALYASISKNLLYRKSFFELFTYNRDWLDKPHLPFWLVLASFKLFGVSEWAYRLPALLFFLVGLRYTWLFSKKFYGVETARFAVLIVAASQHVLMSNTDVRAEPYLLALIIGAIYHISRLGERFTTGQLMLAALTTACAMMTKGLFVIVAIYGALLGQMIFRRKFRELFRLKWVALVLLTLVFTLPELYALYIQFDLHPEKIVFGRTHVSGIRWFFWDSQFGRFASSGPITRTSSDVFFYAHTLLWAFAPWCLLFYYAVYRNLKDMFRGQKLNEYYALSGGLLLLLLFSISRFQLPFYTNAIFPLFAIITAPYCYKELGRIGTWARSIGLWAYIILLPAAVLAVQYFSGAQNTVYLIVDCAAFILLVIWIHYKARAIHLKGFCLACTAVLFANCYLETVFYKEMIAYKGQIKAAEYINRPAFAQYHVYVLSTENNIFQFYTHKPIDLVPLDSFNKFKPAEPSAFFANRWMTVALKQRHEDFKVIRAFENYPQETILPAFINKNTRSKVLDSVYLITK